MPEDHQLEALHQGIVEMNNQMMSRGQPPWVLVNRTDTLCSERDDTSGELFDHTEDSLAVMARRNVEPGKYTVQKGSEELIWSPQPTIPRPLVRAYMKS